MLIPTTILMEIIIRYLPIFENNIKDFINSQKIFIAMVEEKFLKIDDLARNVDIIFHEIDSFKIRSIPPKIDSNKSLKYIKISMNKSRERTVRMRAKRDWLEKACSSSFRDNNHEDLKVIGVTPIESLFANIIPDKEGTVDESTLARRRPNNLEGEDLNEKIDKSGIGEAKTLSSDEPTLLDFKDFKYDNCYLIDCISLL